MTFQAVRNHYEAPIRTTCAALTPAVPVFFDNQPFTEADAAKEHVLMRLSFTNTTEQVLGDTVEALQGVIVIEIYTPKGAGPGRGQRVATEIAKQLNGMNRNSFRAVNNVRGSVGPLTGPTFAALEGRPHFFTRLSCGFRATYTA
jgi:hypothetical protein